jgi:hypothetical protein
VSVGLADSGLGGEAAAAALADDFGRGQRAAELSASSTARRPSKRLLKLSAAGETATKPPGDRCRRER